MFLEKKSTKLTNKTSGDHKIPSPVKTSENINMLNETLDNYMDSTLTDPDTTIRGGLQVSEPTSPEVNRN